MRQSRTLLTVLLAFCMSACATSGPAPESPSAASMPASAASTGSAAHDQRYAVSWQQTATEYEALARMAFNGARARLEPIISAAKANQLREFSAMPADELQGADAGQPLAVIFDVDETLLDNSAYQARLIADGGGFDDRSWNAWCEERRARAIPGSVEFVRWLDGRGVRVFYVTNRKIETQAATADNLRALGFPLDADGANLMTRDDAAGFGKDKVSRRVAIDREHRVVANFGDNLIDFLAGTAGGNASRRAAIADYTSWWGERWFVLPNAIYGSWIDALSADCGQDAADVGLRACIDRAAYRD